MLRTSALVLALFLSGCTSVATSPRPMDYYSPGQPESAGESLFEPAKNSLADDTIKRILDYRLALPAQNRVAVLKLSSNSYWRYYSDDFTQLNEDIATNFIGRLQASDRVYDASFLPSLLVPEQRTLPFLREAAARYQADLLLAYRTQCRTFEKYRLINPDETRAHCTVEAVLLDTRSGTVPFSVVSSNQFSAKKDSQDNNFSETIRKAELAAIGQSLAETADRLTEFLAQVETL
ncbi:hypothetical protein [Marinobacter xestospongiae]|uniref:hypothetical protein n=1 Tax=Marinobacter xestospongiae TaxID=994319 RepID=UPI0020041445|nr:hypothetical protein [Marinobacter xestospongiae]MCK7566901.1 hypothetical protein [Marinobacter xestospongiae]